MAMDMVGERLEEGLKLLPHLAGMVVMVSDKGEGEVRATPDGRAKVSYDFAEKDIQRIKLGMRETARSPPRRRRQRGLYSRPWGRSAHNSRVPVCRSGAC